MLYDITEVCTMLGTTSRTLRFYESEGLIESTTKPPSLRRSYTQTQVDTIKKVLALRALGLSVKKIKELFEEKCSLEDAIRSLRIDIIRFIMEKQRQINLLEDVLHDMEFGKDKEERIVLKTEVSCTNKQLEISDVCTEAILDGNYEIVYRYFSDDLKVMLPEAAFVRSVELSTAPIGKFLRKLPAFRDKNAENVVICPLQYEKYTLRYKYVFRGDIIYGFWTDYG